MSVDKGEKWGVKEGKQDCGVDGEGFDYLQFRDDRKTKGGGGEEGGKRR